MSFSPRSEKAEMATERAAEKKEMVEKNTALESEVARLTGEVKVAAQNARAASGQVRHI